MNKLFCISKRASEDELQIISTQSSDKFCMMSDEAISRRLIHLIDDITEVTFEQVKNIYDEMVEKDRSSPIHIILGTQGGEVRSMLGIMNLLILSKTPCYTYLFGETCSAGAWIYLCGHKRFAPKTNLVSFMLHPMEWNYADSLGNHATQNKYLQQLSKNLIDFTVPKTKLTRQQLRRLVTNQTRYFLGEELFDYGIATDELTDSSFWLDFKTTSSNNKPKQSKVITETVK